MNQKFKNIGRVILCFIMMLAIIYSSFLFIGFIFTILERVWEISVGGRTFESIRIILIILGIFLMIIFYNISFYKIFKFYELIISLIIIEILILIFSLKSILNCLNIFSCFIGGSRGLSFKYIFYLVEGTIYIPVAILIGVIIGRYLLLKSEK